MPKITREQIAMLRMLNDNDIADELTRLYAIEEAAEAWLTHKDASDCSAGYAARKILKGEKP